MSELDEVNYVKNIFDNVNYWVTHAETKNATLIGFNIALLATWFQFKLYDNYYYVIILFLAAIIPSLLSFFPLTKIQNKKSITKETDNLIYFKDIAKYSVNNYIKTISEKYKIDKNKSIIIHYCEEIVVNSKIAVWKYVLFKIGIVLSVFLVSVICIAVIHSFV